MNRKAVTYYLETKTELACEHDPDEDILYGWVGDAPRSAVSYETDEGHMVRLDPETGEFLGVTIFDFAARWQGRPIHLHWTSPSGGGDDGSATRVEHVLHPV